MKSYLYSAGLILITIGVISFLSAALNLTEDTLISLQIPQNNAAVVGIQKYNLPPISKGSDLPITSTRAVLVKNLATDTNLYEYNSHLSLPIASTTKIMTALVASEYFKPNSVLVVGDPATIEGTKVGLVKGEALSFRALLYGMLLNSGNDAAFTLAENYPGGVGGFVQAMNKKANQLGLTGSHFDNPAGFDSSGHFSSASDLAKISQEALKDSTLARIFATKDTKVTSLDKKYKHSLVNLNKLLSQVTGVLGIKTGTTLAAKENLVTLVDRDNHKVLIIVLGSDDRFGESTKIIEWVYSNFVWQD